MYDGIKATTIIPDITEWKKSTGISLMTSINVDSGEQIRSRTRKYDDGSESYKYWANYRTYNLEAIESIKAGKSIWRLNLRGSLHKTAMGGSNAERFTWNLSQAELGKIEADLKIPLADWKMKNIETGLNICNERPVLPFLSQSLLMHRRQPFSGLSSEKGELIGFQSMGCQHRLKVYDKALQLGLPIPLMRIENSVNRMQCLKGLRGMTMADLGDKNTAGALLQSLINTWEDVLMMDSDIIERASGKDKTRLRDYSNTRFWIGAANNSKQQKKFRYHKEVLKELQLKYEDNLHQDIQAQIKREWDLCYN